METIKIQGFDIPHLGFGRFRMPDGEAQPMESAIAPGFRHIDAAVMYENETAVGAAISVGREARGIFRHDKSLARTTLVRGLRSKAIPLTAYAPLAQGRAANHAALAIIGHRHGASATQAAIAWLLDQEGVTAIPKAGKPEGQSRPARQSRETPMNKAPKVLLPAAAILTATPALADT
jgi:diketogulonate reductase-like aldo/keto reductase